MAVTPWKPSLKDYHHLAAYTLIPCFKSTHTRLSTIFEVNSSQTVSNLCLEFDRFRPNSTLLENCGKSTQRMAAWIISAIKPGWIPGYYTQSGPGVWVQIVDDSSTESVFRAWLYILVAMPPKFEMEALISSWMNIYAWREYMGYILLLCLPPACGSWPIQRELQTWTYDLKIPASQRVSADNNPPTRLVPLPESMGLRVNPVRGLESEAVHRRQFTCAFMW